MTLPPKSSKTCLYRGKQAINTSNNSDDNDFHKLLLQFSYEVYERIKANKKPYPNLNSDKVF
ncbi:MAG: hypothetical protein E6X66_09515 [Streptococcus salivarius]|nr:hypothetical protein [Streptococcus salivarius]